MPTHRLLTDSYWPRDESEEIWDINIGDLLRKVAAEVPDRVFLIDGAPDPAARRSWTYVEFLREVEHIARALLARFSPGDRVTVWAPNCPEFLLVQHGLILAGMRLVAANPAYREHELIYILRQSGSAGIFYSPSYRGFDMTALIEQIKPELPALREVVAFGDDFKRFAELADATLLLPDLDPGDPVMIQYTSGTTGFPKGATLHHRGVINAARFAVERGGFADGGVWINPMPMFHIGAGAMTMLGTLARRGTYVLMPGFDPALMLELFETYRGTATLVVPTMLIALLDHPDSSTRDLSSLATTFSGAAVVPAALVKHTVDAWRCGFTIWFGQTELHGMLTCTSPTDTQDDQSQTLGPPLPQVEVKIIDPITRATVPIGTRGEICARGYQTMIGYFELPEETAATLGEDGWLRMGDMGTMDERGYLTIAGRSKDMIIRGGMNIYPREIEDLLFSHPSVSEVAVVGIPDEKWGEQIAAAIKPADPADPPSPDELRAYCRQKLAAHKTPAEWFLVDKFPLTGSGKVQKFVLQDWIASGEVTPTPHAEPCRPPSPSQ